MELQQFMNDQIYRQYLDKARQTDLTVNFVNCLDNGIQSNVVNKRSCLYRTVGWRIILEDQYWDIVVDMVEVQYMTYNRVYLQVCPYLVFIKYTTGDNKGGGYTQRPNNS